MPRGSVSSRSSSISSRKVCPVDKFSFVSECISWDTVIAFVGLAMLLIICILLMNRQQYPIGVNQGDLVETQLRNYSDSTLIKNISNYNSNLNSNSNEIIRVNEIFQPNDITISPNDGSGTPNSERIVYDINIRNVRNRDVNPERPNLNAISYEQYNADKSMERIINPLLPPERSYTNTYGTPINIPSRGPNMSYQQVGILYKENIENPDKQPGNNNDSNILPLFGRPTFNGYN